MRWAMIEFTNYVSDDALEFESLAPEAYTLLHANSLGEAITAVRPPHIRWARIDDSDSPYGGVFTDARYARRYFKLNDSTRSNLLCTGIFAESVLALDFDRLASKEETPS